MKSAFLLPFPFLLISYLSCQPQKSEIVQVNDSGEVLAKIHCASCHQYPNPSLLNKQSWKEYMLPRMGYMLGIYENDKVRDSLIEAGSGGMLVETANIYPKDPVLDETSWQKIQAFYLQTAPEKLTNKKTETIETGLKHFKVVKPSLKLSPPSSTLVKFTENHEIFIGDAHTKKLFHLNANMELIKAGNVNEGAVSIDEIENEIWITVMGSFSPTDAPKGFILNLPKEGGKVANVPIGQLRRPVHSAYGDVTGDGLMDVVVSEFGKWTGRLSLFINQGNKVFERQTLINQTGAIRAYLKDFNKDGLLDIISLFGQGNECMYISYNLGNGKFQTKQILQFSPANGSSYFNLFDFNNDGYDDIIYTAGDNADFKPIMKPYHGIYIFENNGENQFTQTFFRQLNGAYAAIPNDFDLDGDWDIAAISFFPNYKQSSEECFVYLENNGGNSFTASTFHDNEIGRWLVMDAGDIDADGDQDIILGSLAFEVIPKSNLVDRWIKEAIPFIILENTTN
ncbi:MAG: VCBS repeat-containing protein [Bacteroidota bacterium]